MKQKKFQKVPDFSYIFFVIVNHLVKQNTPNSRQTINEKTAILKQMKQKKFQKVPTIFYTSCHLFFL
jgi:hypothetical protein